MNAWRGDQKINNVKNNDPSLSKPLKDDDKEGDDQLGMFD
jgi:hypothetical protein